MNAHDMVGRAEPNSNHLWNAQYMEHTRLSVKYNLLTVYLHVNTAPNGIGVIKS